MSEPASPRPPRRRRFSAGVASVALAGLVACAPPPLPAGDTASGEPSIRVTWPPPESPVQGCELVAVDVQNFDLIEIGTTEPREGEGHYHVYHPGGFESCYKPYCFVDFSDVPSTTEPFFTVALADAGHNAVLDADGNPYEHRIPIEFVPGACTLTVGDSDGTDTGGDSGAVDTGGDSGGGG